MSSSYRSALAAAAFGLASAHVAAAGFEFEPRIEVLALHDDNYRLTDARGTEIEATGGFVDAELAFRSRDPRSVTEFTPRVRTSIFPDEPEEESTDLFVGFGWQDQSQRLEKRIELQYSDESVVTSELLASDFPDIELGDIVVDDSGRFTVRNRRELLSVRPAMSYRWTPRHRVEAGLSYIDAAYDQNLIEQRGYADLIVTGGISVDVSQRDSLTGRLRVGRYEPEESIADTDRIGVEGEWARQWSQTIRLYARGGVETAETDVIGLDAQGLPVRMAVSDTAFVGGLGAAWTYQVTDILLDAVRSVSPSSGGVVIERDEVRLRMRRALRARLAVLGNLRGVRTQGAIEDVRAVRNRDSLSGRLGLEWRMTRALRVLGAFDYAWQEFEGEPTDATSNAVSISFVYEPHLRE